MSRRVCLGQQSDATFGLRVSAPGADVLTASDDGHNFTFRSDWTDIVPVHAVGVGTLTTITLPGGTTSPGFFFSWPALGYMPMLEARRLVSGNVAYDDFWTSTFQFGSYLEMRTGIGGGNAAQIAAASTPDRVLYVIYKTPVPSQ